MNGISNKNVIVAGTPGAWVNVVAGHLHNKGWQITWPGQDIDICDGQLFFTHNKQNIEVQNIHQCICDEHGVVLVATGLPTYYEQPYPGPKEFMEMFTGPVVLSGVSMGPFLDLWVGAADVVIDIKSTYDEDIALLGSWTKANYTKSYVDDVRRVYVSRYNNHLKLFPKVFTMSNSEVRDRRLDALDKFLDSVF